MKPIYRKKGFDTEKYLQAQTAAILERVSKFDGRLYLEFGGKLCYDMHAARVLPGYEPTAKLQLLKNLKDIEIIYCVSAKDLQRGRVRRDFGLTYDNQTIKDVADLKGFGLSVRAVIINRYSGESSADKLKMKLEQRGIDTYLFHELEGYPNDLEKVIGLTGYGRQPYVKISKSIVVVTGAGGNSGKMSFCLSQIYNDQQNGINSGFAKFETFPIWNLPIDHPVNVAYEASTADLQDVNMVDPFHKKAFGIEAINYNRDIENFRIMKEMIIRIVGQGNYAATYNSPTEMGVNTAKAGIIDDEVVSAAAKQEIIRRYFRYARERNEGSESQVTVDWMEKIMTRSNLKPEDRSVVIPARQAALQAKQKGKGVEGIYCGAAIELFGGDIITGKNSTLMHAESAAILNSLKFLASIPDEIDLLSPNVIEKIISFKKTYLGSFTGSLNLEETLISLAISAATNPMAEKAIKMLDQLNNCEMHLTYLPSKANESILIRLHINFTTDAELVL